MKNLFKMLFFLIVVVLLLSLFVSIFDSGDHAPGYGNTSKCTICNKRATHSTSNYGFCDKHWEDAMNYRG